MKHAVLVIANNSSVPYFNWFAEFANKEKNVKLTFVALCKERPKMIDDVGEFGWECYWIRFDHNRRKSGWIWAVFNLIRLFKKLEPDIVHTHLFDDSFPAIVAAKIVGVKKRIVTKGDTAFHWYYARKGVFLDLLINDYATDVVSISGESKNFILQKERADPGKVRYIHHGIQIEKRLAAVLPKKVERFKEQFQLEGKKVIGVVSRLVDWKGHYYILESARVYCKEHSDTVFLIVGNGDLRAQLEEKVKEYGIEKQFVFVGWIDPADMPSLFATFDIFLHAAFMEPFGFVLAEAMAQSLPVLSTKTGAANDVIIHKKNGYLIEPKNSEQIIEGIDWIIANNANNFLGKNASETAKEYFDFSYMYQQYVNLYEGSENVSSDPVSFSYAPKKKRVFMVIANSSNPSYFHWFAKMNYEESGFDLSFVFLHTIMPPMVNEVKKYGVKSYWIYFNTYRKKPLQYIYAFFKFYLLFTRKRPDVVHTNLFDDSLPALLAARCAFVPSRLITKQDTGYHVNFTPSIVKFDRFNNFNATTLIACSMESKQIILENEKGDINKLKLIYHGVDEEFITSSSPEIVSLIKEKYKLQDKFVVGTVARYIDLKGYKAMIKAAKLLVDKYPNIVFLGVGWGRQKGEYEQMIKDLGLTNEFILTDRIKYQWIPSIYSCMDIYLHAAIIEPFGFVIAEAMFNRLPIISTKVGAARDVFEHKKSAYLIDYDNVEQIVEGVSFYMNNNTNDIVQEAYELARKNFSREKMWSGYRDLFLS